MELGSGDGLKTKILLQYFNKAGVEFHYVPIDISKKANEDLIVSLQTEIPELNVDAKTGDYFQELQKLNTNTDPPKVILFLGSNIGNFSDQEMEVFLNHLSKYTNKGDKVLIGFDLKKSPEIIMNAYDDREGLTRRFIFNHLHRINKELDAGFDVANFVYHCSYNPESGALKSYLISKKEHSVKIGMLEQVFHFEKWESIFMELSRKFDCHTIQNLADAHGFKLINNFTDSRNYFVDSLWERR